jgi:RNA polymerase sigma factor (sigma-70 family)
MALPLENKSISLHHHLIERCKVGDASAFQELYGLYAKAMYNVAYRIVYDHEEAQDVLQESFVSAYKNLHAYRGDAPFGAWLKRIVINRALTASQKKKHIQLPDALEDYDIPEQEDSTQYKGELSVALVAACIQQLAEGYRNVLTLYLIEGYDHQEIAEILNISASTSKSQLNRAKEKLKVLITKYTNTLSS